MKIERQAKKGFLIKKTCIAKIFQTFDFSYFRRDWPNPPNWQYQPIEKFDVYLHAKNQAHPSLSSSDTAKILQSFHFGYIGHASIWLPKATNSACRKPLCLPKSKKIKFTPHLLL